MFVAHRCQQFGRIGDAAIHDGAVMLFHAVDEPAHRDSAPGDARHVLRDVADLLRRVQAMATQSNLTIRGFEPQAVASRDLKSIDLGKANIAVVRYDTTFAHKAAAVDLLHRLRQLKQQFRILIFLTTHSRTSVTCLTLRKLSYFRLTLVVTLLAFNRIPRIVQILPTM